MEEWQSIEEFQAFKELERLSDEVWDLVAAWNPLAKDTLGKQLVRAMDSVGANLVEGDGRYTVKEKVHYCYIARGSLKEAGYWMRRAQQRHLVKESQAEPLIERMERMHRWINTLIRKRREWMEVREDTEEYFT